MLSCVEVPQSGLQCSQQSQQVVVAEPVRMSSGSGIAVALELSCKPYQDLLKH
jgi:hypothetical protein